MHIYTSCPQIFPQLVVVGLTYNSDIKFALLLEYLSFERDKNEIKYIYILGSSFECSGKLKYHLYLNRKNLHCLENLCVEGMYWQYDIGIGIDNDGNVLKEGIGNGR